MYEKLEKKETFPYRGRSEQTRHLAITPTASVRFLIVAEEPPGFRAILSKATNQ